MPHLHSAAHYSPLNPEFLPFAVGSLEPAKGFVHVLDDATLDIILNTLDTCPDLTQYLLRKEEFVASGRLGFAAGEENLLAYYLKYVDGEGKHYFRTPEGFDNLLIEDGLWADFSASPDRRAQIAADEVSYCWDRLIDRFAHFLLEKESYFPTEASLPDQETALRLMASEPRVVRRMLARDLLTVVDRADREEWSARHAKVDRIGSPHYLFLAMQPSPQHSLNEYRKVRYQLLKNYCLVAKGKFALEGPVVGLATENRSWDGLRSDDLGYIDDSMWGPDAAQEAERVYQELGLLKDIRGSTVTVHEYPTQHSPQATKGRDRNQPCPCGSGKKRKNCHG
jgi:hypothetical protein